MVARNLGPDSGFGGETDREALVRLLGLDVPVYVQYGRWIGVLPTPDWVSGESHLKGLLQGTLGDSLMSGLWTVEEKIIERLPVTIELGVMAILIGLVIARRSASTRRFARIQPRTSWGALLPLSAWPRQTSGWA